MKTKLRVPNTFKILLMALAAFFMESAVHAQNDQLPEIKRYPFSRGYESPVGIEHAGDSRLFIVERGGKIWIATVRGKKKPGPFLDISDRLTSAGGEQGLLGLAFDPNYKSNGYFYVNYTNPEGDTHISRFKVSDADPDVADADSEVVLLTQEQPYTNHNGGQIKFGPDNYLYIALGDGGSGGDPHNYAQDPSTFLGKMLRIDVSTASGEKMYSIPSDNPYVGAEGYLEEIWATGLRNPFRFSFDRTTGDLWIADVGQDGWEEVNYRAAGSEGGENYGWSCFEGTHDFKADCNYNNGPLVAPIVEYAHGPDPCSASITGGHVYRGRFPNMKGKYFYADYCKGTIATIYQENGEWVNKDLATLNPFSYTSFGENWIGELFLADASKGIIYLLYDGNVFDPALLKESTKEVAIYPNPAASKFTIAVNTPRSEVYEIKIMDQMGKVVYAASRLAETGLNEWEMNAQNFKPGLWFLRLESAEGTINKRFFIH